MARVSSTTTPLGSGATWTSPVINPDLADRITGSVFSDQAGTIYIEQSPDGGANWDVSTSYPTVAGVGAAFSEETYLPTARIRFVNGATAQTTFRLYSRVSSAGSR
jgi:hypothetical protein